MRRLIRDERGSSLAVVLALVMVVSVVGIAAVQTARHSNDLSVVDRERLLAIQAAEAGVGATLQRLETNATCQTVATSPTSLTTGDRDLASYQTLVEPEAGHLCDDTPIRVVHAWGYAPRTEGRTLRHLEVTVRLVPVDGFTYTLFASGPTGIVTVKNTGQIDGDIYAENLDQSQNNLSSWSVVTPGSIDTKNDAIYSGSLWAGGDVTLRLNGSVAGSILAAGESAAGNVLLENNVNITNDVRSAGSITYPTNYTIGGSAIENDSTILPPPQLETPTFTFDQNNYPQGVVERSSSGNLSTALDANKDDLQGVYWTGDPNGTVVIPKNANITGPLTVVTDSKIELDGGLKATGGPWQVVLVSENSAVDAISVPKPAIMDPDLHVLLFSEGGVDLKNNLTMTGAVYADSINVKNAVNIKFSQLLADSPPIGFDFTQASATRFTPIPTLWREIVPGGGPPN